MSRDVEAAERQWRKCHDRAEQHAAGLVAAEIGDWRYHPPADDDPDTWTGLLRWCYVERTYRWLVERESLLKLGGGPYYCPEHGEKRPAAGWQPRACLRCSWDAYLYDETIALARELGRPARRQVA